MLCISLLFASSQRNQPLLGTPGLPQTPLEPASPVLTVSLARGGHPCPQILLQHHSHGASLQAAPGQHRAKHAGRGAPLEDASPEGNLFTLPQTDCGTTSKGTLLYRQTLTKINVSFHKGFQLLSAFHLPNTPAGPWTSILIAAMQRDAANKAVFVQRFRLPWLNATTLLMAEELCSLSEFLEEPLYSSSQLEAAPGPPPCPRDLSSHLFHPAPNSKADFWFVLCEITQ